MYPDTQGTYDAWMNYTLLEYLVLDYNTFNFPLEIDYEYDVTAMVPGPSELEVDVIDMREQYADC